MNHQRFNVGDIGKQGENFKVVNEFLRGLRSAFNLESKNRNAAVREVFFIKRVIGMIFKRGVIDFIDVGIFRQEVDDLQRVLDVALDAQRQSLNALQQNECAQRRDGGAGVAQQDRSNVGDERRRAECLIETHAMIAVIGLDEPREATRLLPIELAALDDDAADALAIAVAASYEANSFTRRNLL